MVNFILIRPLFASTFISSFSLTPIVWGGGVTVHTSYAPHEEEKNVKQKLLKLKITIWMLNCNGIIWSDSKSKNCKIDKLTAFEFSWLLPAGKYYSNHFIWCHVQYTLSFISILICQSIIRGGHRISSRGGKIF